MAPIYVPPPITQLDGSAFAGGNCVATTNAMLLERASAGEIKTTGGHIRMLTGDTSGGLTLDQVRYVDLAFYGVGTAQVNKERWADFIGRMEHRGAIVLVRYNVIAGTAHDCFRGGFFGNHALYVNKRNPDGSWQVMDPGADGRYKGCPKGYQTYSDAFLRKAAGQFITGFSGPAIGLGFVQVLYAMEDAPRLHYSVAVAPPAPRKKTAFFAYKISNGVIVSRSIRGSKGFSADSTVPIRFRWPMKHTTRVLVRLTDGSRKNYYVDAKYARKVP